MKLKDYVNMHNSWSSYLEEDTVNEKAVSKAQQRFMGAVKGCQEDGDCPDGAIADTAASMKASDVDDFAGTKHKGLPEKKKKVDEAGRYHRSSYKGEDPRAQALDQAISLLNDLTYDSLEDDVASYADDAVRAMSKAIEELEYNRNTVGNDPEADAARKSKRQAYQERRKLKEGNNDVLFDMADKLVADLAGADGEPNGWKVLAEEMILAMDDSRVQSLFTSIAQGWGISLQQEESLKKIKEGDWYSDEHETMADKKFADAQAAKSSLQGADVNIVSGGLAGAAGEVLEMTTSTKGEPAVVVLLKKNADQRVMGQAGDEVIALVSDVEVDKGIQSDDDYGDPEDDYNWVGHRAHYEEVLKKIKEGGMGDLHIEVQGALEEIMQEYGVRLEDIIGIIDDMQTDRQAEAGRMSSREMMEDNPNTLTKEEFLKIVHEELQGEINKQSEPDAYSMDDLRNMVREEVGGLISDYKKSLEEADIVESSGNSKEDAIREIASSQEAGRIEGTKLDMSAASAVARVMDTLSPENKERYMAMPIDKMVSIAAKMFQ